MESKTEVKCCQTRVDCVAEIECGKNQGNATGWAHWRNGNLMDTDTLDSHVEVIQATLVSGQLLAISIAEFARPKNC